MAAPNAADIRRARAAMCETCPDAVREGLWFSKSGGAKLCGLSGKPVQLHIESCAPSCPRGLHPGKDGVVTWLGIRWFGVPYPIRLWLRWKTTGKFPGCGCIARLKVAWEGFKARVKRWRCRRVCRGKAPTPMARPPV